jgi:autophagy-related protein 11
MTNIFKTCIIEISRFQTEMSTLPSTITSLTNSLDLQSEAFLQLLHIHRMAPAWGATLVEIVRRKEYIKLFISKAKEMGT